MSRRIALEAARRRIERPLVDRVAAEPRSSWSFEPWRVDYGVRKAAVRRVETPIGLRIGGRGSGRSRDVVAWITGRIS